ncbi:MAG: LysE family transporter [Candidatus Zixiibacteriota bacterium]
MDVTGLFITAFVTGFSGAMMPGPLLAVNIAETPRHGWRTGMVVSTGHAVAEIAVVALLVAGVAVIAENTMVVRVIGVVGGLGLVGMGILMAVDIFRNRVSYDATGTHLKGGPPGEAPGGWNRRIAGKGLVATLTNPFWFIWWGTTGLSFVVKSVELGVIGPVVFYFGHILSDYAWYTSVSIVVWQGKHIIVGKVFKGLLLACAAFLLYLGITFIAGGINGTM